MKLRRLVVDRSATRFHGGGEAAHKRELDLGLRAHAIESEHAVLLRPQLADEFDVVHVWQLQDPREALGALRWARDRGVPSVLTPLLADRTRLLAGIGQDAAGAGAAGATGTDAAAHAEERRFAELRGLALGLADRILCLSQTEADHVVRFYEVARDRLAVTPVGCRPPAKTTGSFGDAPYVLLPASRLEPLKNQLRALRALQELGYPVLVTGTAHDPEYAEACRAAAGPGTMFTGFVRPSVLAAMFAGARVVLHPSLLECASLVVLEAAATGRASLVVSQAGSESEYLGDGARYVDPLDPAAIARAVRDAWSSYPNEGPRRAALCARVSAFTWERAAELTAAALRAAVGQPGAART